MIGVPMPNPRDSIIADLNQQMDRFFGSGGEVQQIASGVSAEMVGYGASSHQDRLKAECAKLAPSVKALADAGKTLADTAGLARRNKPTPPPKKVTAVRGHS